MTGDGPRRNTRQRHVILEELRKLTSHPTAVDLYQKARRRLPKLSLGTVYRNLELLAREGVIQKLELGGAESRFDGNAAQHHHVRCVRCGRVDDVRGVNADPRLAKVKNLSGYRIVGYRLEFSGVCPTCQPSWEPDNGRTPPAKPD